MKECPDCKETKPFSEFNKNGLFKGAQKYKPKCKVCDYKVQKLRFFHILEKFYGKLECGSCGYNKFLGALELHHRNPTKKEYGVSRMTNYTESRIVAELEKCDMLCSNCHREEHHRLRTK